ncbi:MAG: permease-like cell division protein FtsX [Candidatus Margulisiibacteriota bacterium]
MFRDLGFFISEAMIGMRRSGLMSAISIATITVSLVMFGVFLLLMLNIHNLADFISSKLEVRVYLKDSVTQEQAEAFQAKLQKVDKISQVVYIDKDTAWAKFKQNYKNMDLSDFVENNPLPNSFQIFLYDNNNLPEIASYLGQFKDLVDDVGYMGAMAERIELFSRYTKIVGFVLVGLLTFATLLIVVNTIRLTVLARENEIVIMQLVGATKAFIRWPFIIEGLLMGVAGSVIAVVFLKFSYLFFAAKFQESLPYFPLVFDAFKLNMLYLCVALVGTTLGVLGAYISISKTLKSTI